MICLIAIQGQKLLVVRQEVVATAELYNPLMDSTHSFAGSQLLGLVATRLDTRLLWCGCW